MGGSMVLDVAGHYEELSTLAISGSACRGFESQIHADYNLWSVSTPARRFLKAINIFNLFPFHRPYSMKLTSHDISELCENY